ncbi:MAG: NAD(P)H:quinone oxidoreductase [Gudongella sp.]|jgi:NAD(P)H dehydrogenase (quinone)|nr:NAD(P)H:quinone oxidoreductase [Gudongella sp.]
MDKVKLAIIYYSGYGTNYKMAKWAEEAAKEAGAEVRVLKVQELIPQHVIDGNEGMKAQQELTKDVPVASGDDLEWADAFIFSTGARYGNVTSQMKNFFDMQGGLWAQGKLVNKVVSAMSSSQNMNGGAEGTVRSIYTSMMHWGAIIVPPGYSDVSIFSSGGNPYGTTAVVSPTDGSITNDIEKAVKHQAKRTVMVAGWVKEGLSK